MSGEDKIAFLRKARQAGFRTYLYYVATEDPEINISRVSHRMQTGGHAVPREKIVSRSHRSLALLPEAVNFSHRAYIFDNSSMAGQHILVAEVTNGEQLQVRTAQMPHWFKLALWDQFDEFQDL